MYICIHEDRVHGKVQASANTRVLNIKWSYHTGEYRYCERHVKHIDMYAQHMQAHEHTHTHIQTKTGTRDPLYTILRGHEELEMLAFLRERVKDLILPEKSSKDTQKSS